MSKGTIHISTGKYIPLAPTAGKHLVKFLGIFGELLKEKLVNHLDVVTGEPLNTDVDGFTFYEWNRDMSELVTTDLIIGAVYNKNNSTAVNVTLSPATGFSITMNLTKTDTTTLSVDWGDSTSSSTSANGLVQLSKTYQTSSIPVSYSINISATSNYTLGGNSTSYKLLSNQPVITQVFMHSLAKLSNYCFQGAACMTDITLSSAVNTIPAYSFDSCRRLKHVIVPRGSSPAIGIYAFHGCHSLKTISLPTNISSIGQASLDYTQHLKEIVLISSVTALPNTLLSYSGVEKVVFNSGYLTTIGGGASLFDSTFMLEVLDFPSSVTSIQASALAYIYGIKYFIFRATTPPTLANTNAFNFASLALHDVKIYVPDASVSAYKAASNWSTYANYIFPLSYIE